MSNKAHQSAYIATAIKKRRINKNSPKKTNPRCVFISAIFVFAALALTLEARAHAERSHASAFANKYKTNFTAEVKSTFLPCWAAIGNVYSNSSTHSHILARACVLVKRGRGRTDLRKLILLLLLIGGIELNPGPQKLCPLCDRTGRKNSIKIKCGECKKWSHAVCLRLTEKEKKTYRQRGYTCYQCSLPATLSDSFLSLEPPLALNETCESTRTNAYDTNKMRQNCFVLMRDP